MRLILDAMGGDNAPLAPVSGAARAVKELDVSVTLCGDEAKIKAIAAENGISLDGITILHTAEIITMEDQPTDVVKAKKNCSMAVGLQALADGEGDAFISAGNSGALPDELKLYVVVAAVMILCMVILGRIIRSIKIAQALKLGED